MLNMHIAKLLKSSNNSRISLYNISVLDERDHMLIMFCVKKSKGKLLSKYFNLMCIVSESGKGCTIRKGQGC